MTPDALSVVMRMKMGVIIACFAFGRRALGKTMGVRLFFSVGVWIDVCGGCTFSQWITGAIFSVCCLFLDNIRFRSLDLYLRSRYSTLQRIDLRDISFISAPSS